MLTAAAIQSGIDAGTVAPDVQPEKAAKAFLALRFGLLTMWRKDETLFQLHEQSKLTIEFCLRAIAAK